MKKAAFIASMAIAAVLCARTAPVRAHAFPEHSMPRVGSTVKEAPSTVSIWFDGYLEPAFSTIEIYDSGQKRIDKGDGHVDGEDRTLLTIGVPELPPGKYRVVWAVVAVDGHRTEGDFTFRVDSSP